MKLSIERGILLKAVSQAQSVVSAAIRSRSLPMC